MWVFMTDTRNYTNAFPGVSHDHHDYPGVVDFQFRQWLFLLIAENTDPNPDPLPMSNPDPKGHRAYL